MTGESLEQLVRIILFSIGGYFFGDGVVGLEVFQAAVGGAVSIATFGWWYFWERKRVHNKYGR